MAGLGISLYPGHSTLDKDKAYMTLTAKYGFKQAFTCLLSVEKEHEEILAEFRELIDHACSYGTEIILDVAPSVLEKLHVSYDDLSFFAGMHTDDTRLDEGFDSLKETLTTYNPQNLKIEVNVSLSMKYLDNAMSHYPKPNNIVTCHSFYPQRYSGISHEHSEKCNQDIEDLNIKAVAFVSSQEKGTYSPWPVSEGLCTSEMHRDPPINVQARHLFATRPVDDVIIANVYVSEEELSMSSKIDPGKLTFKIGFEAGLYLTEGKTLYGHPHFVRGDISGYMARSIMLRITYAEESVPPENTRDLKHGDAVIVNDEYSRCKGELHIVSGDMPDDGGRNVIGHMSRNENTLLDHIKSRKSSGFMRQYQEGGKTMATPIYRKIKDLTMREIKDKAANSPVDSERDMAIRPGASRMTVRRVIDELADEGLLYRNKNKGTFVADRKLLKRNIAAEMLQGEVSEFIAMYFNVKDVAGIAPILEIGQDDQVLSVVQLNTVNSKSTSVEEIFSTRNQILDADMKSLKNLLDMNDYMKNGHVTRKFIPVLAPVQFANLLRIKMNTPIIRVKSVISSTSGKPLVYARVYNDPFESVIGITLQYDEAHLVIQPGAFIHEFAYGICDGSVPQRL